MNAKEFFEKYDEGRKLLTNYDLQSEGIWLVEGEDPNCDMGGHHYNPFLGYFEGKLQDVVELALQLKGFFQWGAGGKITKVNPIPVKRIS